jgi:hypothetical protein
MKKIGMIIMMLGAIAAVSACSSGSGADQAAADTAAATQQTGDNAGQSPGNRVRPDVIGKVASVGNGKIVVYASDTPPRGPGGNGGAQGGGARPSGRPNGGQSGGQGGQRGQGGGGGGMRNMQFSDQTTEYAYNDQTQVSSRTFGNQGGGSTTLNITELKEGDIISMTLSEDKTTAVSIQLMPSRGPQPPSPSAGS